MIKKYNIIPILFIFIGISAFIRIYYPYDFVFTGEWIKFTSIDAYYHMRIVDTLAYNFPQLTWFDPYFIFPIGRVVSGLFFFDWFMAGIAWVIGLGQPTKNLVDLVGVYSPVILAALTIIPIYFIGKEIFNKTAGILAAGFIAIIPGEFLGRSVLGFADQHIMEVLLSTISILLLMVAIRKAREGEGNKKVIVYSLSAGLVFSIYVFTWVGSPIFLFMLTLFIIIQFINNHISNVNSIYLCKAITPALFVTAIAYLVAPVPKYFVLAVMLVWLLPFLMHGISHFTKLKNINDRYYLLSLAGLCTIAVFAANSLLPDLVGSFSIFNPIGSSAETTLEMRPIFSPYGEFTFSIAWSNFAMGLILAPIAVAFLIWNAIRNPSPKESQILLLVWSAVILLATISQRRFAYYLAINVALLSAYVLAYFVTISIPKKRIAKKVWKRKPEDVARYFNLAIVITLIILIGFMPTAIKAKDTAAGTKYMPSDAWMESLQWLRDNSLEPMGDSGFYYKVIGKPSYTPNYKYDYPESAYGVTAWWDYGYWISREAHRMPSANPSQDPIAIKKVAELFLSDSNNLTSVIMQELQSNYLIIDSEMIVAKYHALLNWTDRDISDYMGTYYYQDGNILKAAILFYPDYYKSLCIHLYNYSGQEVTSEQPIVVVYEYRETDDGKPFKLITGNKQFDTYQEALDYVGDNENMRIVGVNPSTSPIALQRVSNFNIAHVSTGKNSTIKIFEYDKGETENE